MYVVSFLQEGETQPIEVSVSEVKVWKFVSFLESCPLVKSFKVLSSSGVHNQKDFGLGGFTKMVSQHFKHNT